MMRAMFENPMVQRMLENPETIRMMVQSNPMMRAMIEQNPQMEQMLTDPQLMRQAMQAATNPAVMQELLRSQDRALANIESLPGGHNALRRMYEQEIDQMVQAAEQTMYQQSERQANQQSSQQQQQQQGAGGPSSAPMPNPWSTPAPQQQQRPAQASPGANPWAAFAGGGGNPAAGLGGLGAGGPMAGMMQDPDYMRRLMEPANMQAMMQLQQAVEQLRRGGVLTDSMFPGGMPPMFGGGMGGPGAGAFGGLGGGMPNTSAPAAPQQPPEERFAIQLLQLESMGFTDRASNIRALVATNGNVNAAIERLLQS